MALFIEETCAAALSGSFACACTCGKPNSTAVWVPFFRLHGSQASARLLTRSLPPLALGILCSSSRGIPVPPQHEHRCSHLSRKYSPTRSPSTSPSSYCSPLLPPSSSFSLTTLS